MVPARGNPGPGGWGAVLIWGTQHKCVNGAVPETTNNRMELQAAIEALTALSRASQVRLYTDSRYVRDGITRWLHKWKRSNWKTAAKKTGQESGFMADAGSIAAAASG